VKQRKKQREEAGGVAKRGRPSKGSGSSGSKAAAPAQVSPVSGQENAAPAAAGKEQQADAMEVDEPAVVDAPAGMQKQPFAAQTPAAPAAPVEQAAVQAAGGAAEDASPAAAPLPSATPVPHPGNAPSELAAAMQQDVSASPTPAAAAPGAAAGDAVSPAAAAAPAAQAAKTPASAPARAHSLSVEEAVQLATELEEEAKALHAGGLALPLLSLPSDPPAAREPFSDARLAEFVAAQRAPLSALVAALAPLFASPDSGAPLEEAVLRRWASLSRTNSMLRVKCQLGGGGWGDVCPGIPAGLRHGTRERAHRLTALAALRLVLLVVAARTAAGQPAAG
jgi:hypothetical protein